MNRFMRFPEGKTKVVTLSYDDCMEEDKKLIDLMEKYEMTQEALSKAVGKSRSVIANSVRLLNMPDRIQDMLKKGIICPALRRRS